MANAEGVLLEALQDLKSKELKSFTRHLTNGVGSFERIPRGQLENADSEDIVEKMVDNYEISGAIEATLTILKKIHKNRLAEELDAKLSRGGSSGVSTPAYGRGLCAAGGGGSSGVSTPAYDALKKAAFIDDKWAELVQRATGVEAVLDVLLSRRIINDEQYSEICSERIAQRMMRRLIREPLRASGDSGKIVLYDVLMALQPYMMKDLGAS